MIKCQLLTRLIFSSKGLLIVVLFRLNNMNEFKACSKLAVHHVCSVKSDPVYVAYFLVCTGSKPLGEKLDETPFKMWIIGWYTYNYNVITVIFLKTLQYPKYVSNPNPINKQQIKCRSKFIMYKEAKTKEPWAGWNWKTHFKQFYFIAKPKLYSYNVIR